MSIIKNQRRVVITGMGVIAPNGNDLVTFWESIVAGNSAADFVRRFDTSKLPNQLAAEVKDFDASLYIDPKRVRRCDLVTQYAVAAASQALGDADLKPHLFSPDRIGIVEGTTVSGMESMFHGQQTYLKGGYKALSPFTVINAYCGEGSSTIAFELGLQAHAITYCSGCASGNDAIGYAALMIQQDETDIMVAGATDFTMAEPMYGGFCLLRVMSRRNDFPKGAMRPFDRTRDGFVLGEGAAFLILEELTHALGRRAKIYAEVLGHGRSCEAYHSTDTHPEGIGFCRSIEKALRKAELAPSDVDYINAHGTATATNDPIETRAIKNIFKEHANSVAISSTKPVTGHMMGAAGAVESVVCAMALKHQLIPPTINLHDPAPECDLDYVPLRARSYPLRIVANLSAGFGGKNSCLLLGRAPVDR
jgi:3-oxoacyl-[acyl-carrier-protein] synthase II